MSALLRSDSRNDQFDEVDLSSNATVFQPTTQGTSYTSMTYLNRKNAFVHNIESTDSFTTSSSDSLQGTAGGSQEIKQAFSSVSTTSSSSSSTVTKTNASYSPSKKLKKIRELHKEDFEIPNDIDNSDDELDDSTIIFDVPMSQSLTQLASPEKVIHLNSMNSQSTQQSSLMSFDYSSTDADSDIEETGKMTTDGKMIRDQFYRTKSTQTIQESQLRKHYINSWVQRPKSIEGDRSFSKLKSKVVSNTRPTYLPPKPTQESINHEKKVQELRIFAIKQEAELEKKKLQELRDHERIKSKDLYTWTHDILPDFENKIQLSSTRELWWRGIPTLIRADVWIKRLNNKCFSEEEYHELKLQAESLLSTEPSSEVTQNIQSDITKVFPDLCLFQTGQQFHNDLILLMMMYHTHKGYEQGLITLGAVLLNTLKDLDASFVCLVGVLQRHLLKSLYANHEGDLTQFNKDSESFLRTFSKLIPQLYDHFHTHLKLKPQDYLVPLVKPLFSNILPINVCSSIIDVFIFEGDSAIWRTVLGLLSKISYKLYGSEEEILDVIGWNSCSKLNSKRRMDPGTLEVRYLDVGEDYEFLKTVRDVLKKS
ncbi:hypothetical protein WICPIJ_005018 [Wickerhamomyces pijperi]|uniref:Rab-GAP TBC domain-containing protein n=1 Tax=Wickerhamomyces pijperi TaxID=599730 RepID=A0A9P8Q6R5_WICPI|nr:hypothetical protein WICPIJ_005018 [Wickerhamomyces pijperi]